MDLLLERKRRKFGELLPCACFEPNEMREIEEHLMILKNQIKQSFMYNF